MQIPLYQIKNILKLYSQQLSLGEFKKRDYLAGNDAIRRDTSEGKRKTVIDKVVSSIMDRIISDKPSEKNRIKITHCIKNNPEGDMHFLKNRTQFTYTMMDENNRITTHTLPVESSTLFVRRIMEMNRKVSNNIDG